MDGQRFCTCWYVFLLTVVSYNKPNRIKNHINNPLFSVQKWKFDFAVSRFQYFQFANKLWIKLKFEYSVYSNPQTLGIMPAEEAEYLDNKPILTTVAK